MTDETSRSVKARILEAAVSLLRKAGAKKLAQPQVAREAGVPQGHLTYYFPRKMDLLLGVAGHVAQAFEQELEKTDSREDGKGGLTEALTDLVFNHERNRSLIGLISEADVEEEVATPVQKAFRFAQLTAARTMNRHPDAPETQLTVALVLGLGLQQLLYKDRSRAQVTELLTQWNQWLVTLRANDENVRQSGTVVRGSADSVAVLRPVASKKA